MPKLQPTKKLLLRVLVVFAFFSMISLGSAHKILAEDLNRNSVDVSDYFGGNPSKETNKVVKAIDKNERDGETSLDPLVNGVITSAFVTSIGFGGGERAIEDLINSSSSISDAGLMGDLVNLTASLYSQPASAKTYIADLLHSTKIVPKAYAQGLGFASLDPVLEAWKVFRNIAYFFFVIIFLVIGVMIMLRHKISGQTVVTIQQALPNIIVALIFVTFSYAIAGFLIDIMYLSMYFIVGIFGNSNEIINANIFGLARALISAGWSQSTATDSFIKEMIRATALPNILTGIGGLTVALIMVVAIIYGLFKLFFELLKSYVIVILQVAFSPLILMVGAVPGQNTFKPWLMNIIGNLAAFPVVLVLLILQQILEETTAAHGGFMPPFLIGSGLGGTIPSLVGFGILLAAPEIIKKIKEKLGATEGVFGELAGTAWERFNKGRKTAGTIGSRAVMTPAGAAIGSIAAKKKGIPQGVGMLGGAAAGAIGPRKLVSKGYKAIRDIGEFAENEKSLGFEIVPSIARKIHRNVPWTRDYIDKFMKNMGRPAFVSPGEERQERKPGGEDKKDRELDADDLNKPTANRGSRQDYPVGEDY